MKPKMAFFLSLGVAALLVWPAAARADDTATIKELQNQVKALQEQVQKLQEAQSAAAARGTGQDEAEKDKGLDGLLGRDFLKSKGLTFGFYGETKYRFPESGANSFDAHRFVLLPGYQFADWLVFNAELELEHGAVDESVNGGRNRFNGELELEQFYVDILLNEHFNIRSLGIDVMPVGRISKYHEPTVFYSTERPELYREIIPTTWQEPSLGIFGKIVDNLDYQLTVSTGLEDFIPAAGLGAPGITAADGLRNARPRLRASSENSLGYSGRLHYSGLKGLDTSASFYLTQVQGVSGNSWLSLWDVEALYRVPKTGLELRGDFAYWHLGSPQSLVVNNNASTTDNVGDAMYGWYLEAAWHLWPEAWRKGKGKDMDLVPFIRYTDIVTQSGVPVGSTSLDNGTANKDFFTAGVSYFLNQNFVLKADWRRNLNGSTATKASAANQDYFQIGAGMFF
ncbi:MAG: hypothetical protein AAB676_13925 [Verrucomicrobiota bacterium]